MKLHFTNEWLKETILNTPDHPVEIGPELLDAMPFVQVVEARERDSTRKKAASRERTLLSAFIGSLRRREKLSFAEMAKRLGVSSDVLKRVETEPLFTPSLDFIERFARFINVPTFEAQRLANGRAKERAIDTATRKLINDAKAKAGDVDGFAKRSGKSRGLPDA